MIIEVEHGDETYLITGLPAIAIILFSGLLGAVFAVNLPNIIIDFFGILSITMLTMIPLVMVIVYVYIRIGEVMGKWKED
jgi:hypothetical protein